MSTTAGALGVMTVLPARILGREGMAPSEKLNIALVALGGRGAVHARELRDQNIVAVCDVDWRTWQNSPKRKAPSVPLGVTPNVCAIDILPELPRAKRYDDWRIMFDQHGREIDAVVVATPEHSHAGPSIAAMQIGKHVYCEKPLARSIDETRAMVTEAGKHKVITQFGVQGHSGEDVLSMVEWIRDGAIGDVKEVRIFDGLGGKSTSDYSFLDQMDQKHEIPADFNWDQWLGPAPFRPYNTAYGPRGYGRWRDFGGGIGGIGCHLLDGPFWALDLGLPETIEAERQGAYDFQKHSRLYASFAKLRYQFPARGMKPPVMLIWDRTTPPPMPEGWDPKEKLPFAGGIIYGSKGAIVFGNSWACLPRSAATGAYKPAGIDPAYKPAQIYPLELAKAYQRKDPELPRPFSHWVDWMDAIKAGRQAGAPFDYGGALTEVNQLGDIASMLAGTVLHYDAKKGRFANNDVANSLMSPPPYRKGWTM